MGFLSGLFGGEDTPRGATTTTTSGVPQYVQDEYQDLVGRSVEESQQPYEQYGGQRLAGFTPEQEQAFAQTQANQGLGQQLLQEGVDLTRGAMGGPTTAGIQQYMNPFQELVTQNTLREMQRANKIGGIQDAAQGARLGAFGGSRTGVVEAERARNFDRLQSDFLAQQQAANYGQAQNIFAQQQGVQMGGARQLQGLGGALQGMNQADVQALLGTGGQQQLQQQLGLDIGYGDYLREQQDPKTEMAFLQNILRGAPRGDITETRTPQRPSKGSIFGSILSSGIGALGTALGSPAGSVIASGIGSFLSGGGGDEYEPYGE